MQLNSVGELTSWLTSIVICIKIRDGIQILHDAIQFPREFFMSWEALNKKEKRREEKSKRDKINKDPKRVTVHFDSRRDPDVSPFGGQRNVFVVFSPTGIKCNITSLIRFPQFVSLSIFSEFRVFGSTFLAISSFRRKMQDSCPFRVDVCSLLYCFFESSYVSHTLLLLLVSLFTVCLDLLKSMIEFTLLTSTSSLKEGFTMCGVGFPEIVLNPELELE